MAAPSSPTTGKKPGGPVPQVETELSQLDSLLDEERDSNQYLGDTMFWREYEFINAKNVLRSSSIEYKNLKLMVYETIFYLVLLFVLTYFIWLLNTSEVYDCKLQQMRYWGGCGADGYCKIEDVKTAVDIVDWLGSTLPRLTFTDKLLYMPLSDAPSIYGLNEESIGWSPRYVGDTKTNILLGNVRVRQLRVMSKPCQVTQAYQEFFGNCYPAYENGMKTTKAFAKRWTPKYATHAYGHKGANQTQQVDFQGHYSTYPGDGFQFDLPLNYTMAKDVLQTLKEWDWCDSATRAVVVEMTVLNPNVNIIVSNRLTFEVSTAGSVKAHHIAYAFRVCLLSLSVMTTDQLEIFMYLVMTCALFLIYTALTMFYIWQCGTKFFRYIWNVMDLLILALFYMHLYYRFSAYIEFDRIPEAQPEMVGHPEVFLPLSRLVPDLTLANNVLAFLGLLAWFKVFKYLTLTKTFRLLVKVLERCGRELCVFAALLMTIFTGFSIAFHVGFGAYPDTLFASLQGSYFGAFFMLANGVSLDPLFATGEGADAAPAGVLGAALFILYLVMVYFVLFNMFMAIVVDAYTMATIHYAMPGSSKDRDNPMVVFLWTYYNKLKGVSLVGSEPEEDVGHTTEQYIELGLLPEAFQKRFKEGRGKMVNLLEDSNKQLESKGAKSLTNLLRQKTGQAGDPSGAKAGILALQDMDHGQGHSSADTEKRIQVSRVQIQRLMQEDEKLVDLFGTERAIDVIRRFKVDREPDQYEELSRLQSNVIAKMEELGKEGMLGGGGGGPELEFSELESLRMVTEGLHEALTEVQQQWRTELTMVLQVSETLSSGLKDLTKTLEKVQTNHSTIVHDMSVQVMGGP